MLKLLSLSVLFMAGSAFADIGLLETNFVNISEAVVDLGQDPYSELEQAFTNAGPATHADVSGWTAGRCYRFEDHKTPLANLLVGERKQSENNGPRFPSRPVDKVLSVVYLRSNAPDAFDDMSESLKSEIAAFVDQLYPQVTEAQGLDGSWVSRHESGSVEYRVRKDAQYLYMQAVATADVGDIKKGSTVANCYYFKKVK